MMRTDESSPALYLIIAVAAMLILGAVILVNLSELTTLLRGLSGT